MGSLRVLLYLVRDTLHRWLTRISSPLARVMVVFFLSFSGLVFLSSYVLSVKALRSRIHRAGAGVLIAVEVVKANEVHTPPRPLLPHNPAEYTQQVYHEAFVQARVGQAYYPLVELPPRQATLLPQGARSGLLLLPERPTTHRLPVEVTLENHTLAATTLPEPAAGELRQLWPAGAVLMPAGSLPAVWERGCMRKYVLHIAQVDSEHVTRRESVLRILSRLDKRNLSILGNAALLRDLEEMERVQYRVRVMVALGISLITCLLLTSIASLEYRQNQYVYALLGSFGTSRPLLFLSYLGENCTLVGIGFGAALAALHGALHYMTHTLYRLPDLQLSMWELEDDIRTFTLSLGVCIAASGIPILVAICRPIGKVLK